MAVITTAMAKTWDRTFTDLFFDNYTKIFGQGQEIFDQINQEQPNHYIKKGMLITMGPGLQMEEGKPVPFDTFLDGPQKTVYPMKFGIALQATYEAMKDDRQGVLKQCMAKIGESMKYTIELIQTDMLNSAFVTTNRVGIDGAALVGNHTRQDGSGVVASNSISGSLSRTTLQAAIDTFTTMVDERGKPIVMMPRVLVIPPQLEWKAKELLMSEYDPESANNSINPLTVGNKLTYMVNRYLTSTTAWFVLADKANHDLKTYWWDKPSQMSWVDNSSDNMIFKSTMRMVPSFWNWRGVVGGQ